jgi:hypothetical protein
LAKSTSLTSISAVSTADADDPSQVPYHGVWFGLGLLLQSFLTSPLDLLDLADDGIVKLTGLGKAG